MFWKRWDRSWQLLENKKTGKQAAQKNGEACKTEKRAKLKNWKTASNKPVKNRDLWQLLDESSKKHDINWKWVKGHSGHRENDIADQLANKGIDEL